MVNFDIYDIEQQVLARMRELDIEPYDEKLQLDGQLHRYRTKNDKKGHFSGAYCIFTDGLPAGFFQDWRTGVKEDWKFDTGNLPKEQQSYFKSSEFQKKAKEIQRKRDEEREQKQKQAAEHARQLWEQLRPAQGDHPYLQKKHIYNYGFKIQENNLAVPLKNIDGVIQSIQWIMPDGTKRFQPDAPLEGAFFGIALDTIDDTSEQKILIGEGVATMCKVYELTEYPCVAAKNCGSLENICKIFHEKFPKSKIVIIADDDKETELKSGKNPGITAANQIVKKGLANGTAIPPFKSPKDGTDWDDFAIKYGDEHTKAQLIKTISWEAMTSEERKEKLYRLQLTSFVHNLDPKIEIPPQEYIGGLFARQFVSLLIAPSGTGKTIFMQKFCSDLSIGGSILGDFVEDEPVRKILIFAGEAGYKLLIRRAASLKWDINPLNVQVVDQYEFETKNMSVMLDSEEGWRNIKTLVDIYKPDITFFDTLMSFHTSDSNKEVQMKPIMRNLMSLAIDYNMAVVPVHHTRKRLTKERNLSLDQDDAVGSGVLNRLVGLIIGIEPMKDDENNTLLVRPLKSWFPTFTPFTFKLTPGLYGGTVFETDLAPAAVNNSRIIVWNYILENFSVGEWFSTSQIILSEMPGNIADRQLRRILNQFTDNGKLQQRGFTKSREYCLPSEKS